MADSRRLMIPDPSLITTDVIMTSLLLWKIICVIAYFLILPDFLLFKFFCALRLKINEFGFCQKIQHYEVIMTPNYVIVSIMICLDVENYEYIILCNFVALS